MTTTPDLDGPTLGEIARVVYAIQQDVRSFRSEHVRSDVYTIAHSTLVDRVKDLESAAQRADESRRAYQRIAVGAILASMLSIAAQLVQAQL